MKKKNDGAEWSGARSGRSRSGNGAESGCYRDRLERGAAFSPAPLTCSGWAPHMLTIYIYFNSTINVNVLIDHSNSVMSTTWIGSCTLVKMPGPPGIPVLSTQNSPSK